MGKNTASSWLIIDLGALGANYRIFKDKAGTGCAAAGVIKADGYGLGVDKVLAALENEDCPLYFVATLDEALHLRSLTKKPVAVLGGLYRGAEDIYIHENLTPVLNSLEDIKTWGKQTQDHEIPLPAIIHFDTGMSRLGLCAKETQILHDDLSILDGIKTDYMMSHFACADEKDHPMNEAQCEAFKKATAPFAGIKKSLANSSGAFRSENYHFDLLRPGMALYGLNPTPETANPMQPVVSLETRVLQVRNAEKGDTAGYGATYRFEKKSVLATVALGYADGFLRTLSSSGSLYYGGHACPIRGRVSMDLVIVDITGLEQKPAIGDVMEVIGPHQDADMLADAAGTIGYEILTDLGKRYARTYSA